MRSKRIGLIVLVLVILGLVQVPLYGQSPTTGLVNGTVLDPSNASVAGAKVTLQQEGTGVILTATTDASGLYVFPTVTPATYTLTATAPGFEKTVIKNIVVNVLRSYTVNVSLKIGAAAVTVEVTAEITSQLETTSSTVGAVLAGTELEYLPVYTRSASALMFLQPAVSPPDSTYQTGAPNDYIGGQISGSRAEQVTFLLDGGDVTSDLEGTNNYNSPPHEPQPAPIVPMPQEMTQEFRVGVSNANATFDRSSGGQVAVLSKSGTNTWHGEGYEFNNNDAFNANGFNNNEALIHKPHEVDNRFGGNLGGPIYKNKLWFFAGYEGRRFYENATNTRIVPLPSLAEGMLTFPDATGTNRTYNLATAADCGPNGTAACDPRGIGISPTIAAQMKLYPAASPGAAGAECGDGLNTACYVFSAPVPFLEDIGIVRLDYSINSKWNAFATYHIADARRTVSDFQAQISATAPASYPNTDPYYPTYFSFQVTGQLTPSLTLVSHGSYLRNWWGWNRYDPGTYGIAGTTQVLELTGEGVGAVNTPYKYLADPVNINTQQARAREWDGRDVYISQDLTNLRGNHELGFGASFYRWHDFHFRTDDVLGGLTNFPTAYIESIGNGYGLYNTVGPAYEPPACPSGSTTATYCLPPGLATNWDELYSAVLGIVDHSSQIATYNGQFQPNLLGSGLTDNVTMYSPYGYLQDTWKVKPSITLTFGVDWGAQLPPSEANGKEALLTYASSGEAVNFSEYLSARETMLGAGIMPGQPFNPQFAVTPVADVPAPLSGQFKVNDWHDFGPRFSVAWNVPGKTRLFGNNKTVIRAGYSLLYDRTSAVGEVLNPLLAGGLASADICGGPVSSGVADSPAICTNGPTTPLNAYRIGVDGPTAPIPTPTAEPIPYVFENQFLTSALDPYATPAHAHNVNLDIQRALPWKMVAELGYIGKFSRNLPQGQSLNDPYYLSKDAISGQTLASAFSAVATAVQKGTAIPTEPWFEDQLGGAAKCVAVASELSLSGVTNCSTLVAAADPFDFSVEGLGNWAFSQGGIGLNTLLPMVGFPQMDDQQILAYFSTTSDHAYSNYNAFFTSLNKSAANVQFQFNWTWSKAIGTQGINQQYLYASNSPYNLGLDYGPEVFDHKQVVNFLTVYNLPFGEGQRYKTGNRLVDKVVGGWTISGIFSYYTGLPMEVDCDGDFGSAYFLLGSGVACNSSLNLAGLAGLHTGVGTATSSNPNDGFLSGQTVGGGTGLNIFANPAAVLSNVTPPNISTTKQIAWGQLRMIPSWNVDFGITKNFAFTERVKLEVRADFLNIFNQVQYAMPSLDTVFAGPTFGELTTQQNAPRNILLGARLVF